MKINKLERIYNFVIAFGISIFVFLSVIGIFIHQFFGYAVYFAMFCCMGVVFGGMLFVVLGGAFLMFKEAITGEKQDWPGGGPYY